MHFMITYSLLCVCICVFHLLLVVLNENTYVLHYIDRKKKKT